MSRPKCEEAHPLLSRGWPLKEKLGHLRRGVRGRLSGLKRELLGWKHPRAQILGKKGLKKKEMKEEKMGLSLRFVYLLFPSLFSSFFFMVVFPPSMS